MACCPSFWMCMAGVSNTKSRSTWLIVSLTSRQPRASPADSDYALPFVTNFLCRVTNSAHLVVGPLLSLDQRLRIRCRPTSAIRRVVTSLSDVHWKHFCSLSTSVSGALEVFYDDALYKPTLSIYLSLHPLAGLNFANQFAFKLSVSTTAALVAFFHKVYTHPAWKGAVE